MEIEIDYNPSPNKSFFIGIKTDKDETISFDCTDKRIGIIKQKIVERKPIPKGQKIDEERKTIVLKDGRFDNMYSVKWVDQGDLDWCNDEVWQLIREKPLDDKLIPVLLNYSHLICDNYKTLDKYSIKIQEFENLLQNELKKYL